MKFKVGQEIECLADDTHRVKPGSIGVVTEATKERIVALFPEKPYPQTLWAHEAKLVPKKKAAPKKKPVATPTPVEFKVGDRVRIAKSSRYYSRNDAPNPRCEGRVATVYSVEDPTSLNHTVDWDNARSNSYSYKDLELVTETQPTTTPMAKLTVGTKVIISDPASAHNGEQGEIVRVDNSSLPYKVSFDDGDEWFHAPCVSTIKQETTTPVKKTLETVYTVAPQVALQDVIYKAANAVGFTASINDANDRYTCLFYDVRYPIKLNACREKSASLLEGRTEVSIPEFLELLAAYKTDVKVELTSHLTATIDATSKQVKITGLEKHAISFASILELEKALAETGKPHGLKDGQWVNPGHHKVTKALIELAVDAKVSGADGLRDYVRYPVLSMVDNKLNTISMDGPYKQYRREEEQITVTQFIEAVTNTTKPVALPALAGRTPERLPNGGVKFGCQDIPGTAVQELFKAVHAAN